MIVFNKAGCTPNKKKTLYDRMFSLTALDATESALSLMGNELTASNLRKNCTKRLTAFFLV